MNVVWHHFHDFNEHSILRRYGQQHVLESCLNITNENFAAILWAPHDVILETEYCSRILAVPAVSAD